MAIDRYPPRPSHPRDDRLPRDPADYTTQIDPLDDRLVEDQDPRVRTGAGVPEEPAITIPGSFWQQLLALMLQLFSATPGAREHPAMQRLQTMHTDLHRMRHAGTVDEDALRQQEEAMKPENRERFEREEAEKVAAEGATRAERKAKETKELYGTAQVDNSAREAKIAHEAHLGFQGEGPQRNVQGAPPTRRFNRPETEAQLPRVED